MSEMLDLTDLMHGLSILHLRFTVRAEEPISFQDQPGSALRGALYGVLRNNFCSEVLGFSGPDHTSTCPVCWLLRAEDTEAGRGKDVARPLMIQPPLGQTHFAPGDTFTFGMTLVGQAQELLLFVVQAVHKMGRVGIGRTRGRFTLLMMAEYDPLLDATRPLLEGRTVRTPKMVVTPARILAAATNLSSDALILDFLTPMRLTAQGQLVKTPDLPVLLQRLIERCQNLAEHYSREAPLFTREAWRDTSDILTATAAKMMLVRNATHWVEAYSGSQRQQRITPISGFVGCAQWQGDLQPLLPWLLWGQSLHVGKDAVKGNGWYQVEGGQ